MDHTALRRHPVGGRIVSGRGTRERWIIIFAAVLFYRTSAKNI